MQKAAKSVRKSTKFLTKPPPENYSERAVGIEKPISNLRGTWAGSMLLARAATLQAAGRTNEALEAYRAVLTHQSATKGHKNTAEEAIEAIGKRQ